MLPHRLPNAELAWVPLEKMTEYLLNPLNPRAGRKPQDFAQMGYDNRNVDVLERDLTGIARDNPPIEERTTAINSTTYRVGGFVATPIGSIRYIRTVWEIRPDDPRPRLVTAYPVKPPSGG